MSEDAKMQAWRALNVVLDWNGDEETDEYRAAFARWQELVMTSGGDDE